MAIIGPKYALVNGKKITIGGKGKGGILAGWQDPSSWYLKQPLEVQQQFLKEQDAQNLGGPYNFLGQPRDYSQDNMQNGTYLMPETKSNNVNQTYVDTEQQFLDIISGADSKYLKDASKYLDTTLAANTVAATIPSIMNLTAPLIDKMQYRSIELPEYKFDNSLYEKAIRDTMGATISNQNYARQYNRPDLLLPMENQKNQAMEKILETAGQERTSGLNQYQQAYVAAKTNENAQKSQIDQINAEAQAKDNQLRSEAVGTMMSGLGQLATDYGLQKINIGNYKNQNTYLLKMMQDALVAGDTKLYDQYKSMYAQRYNYIGASNAHNASTDVIPKK